MPVPSLIIGLGGTGLKALLMIKERLIEAYGELPKEVKFLELDTDRYPTDDKRDFNGVELIREGAQVWDSQAQDWVTAGDDIIEFHHLCTRNEDEVINDKTLTKEGKEWSFIDKEKILSELNNADNRKITTGARTIRPISKLALYLDYKNTFEEIKKRTEWLKNQPLEQDKSQGRLFVIGSAAGGSGAGLVIDILKMLSKLCQGNNALPISCLLAGGLNFINEDAKGPQPQLSNTFAVLREVERLGAMSVLNLPRTIPGNHYFPNDILRNEFAPANEVLIFDRPDRLSRERVRTVGGQKESYLDCVTIPAMADYVTSIIDKEISEQMDSFKADFKAAFGVDAEHEREYTYFGVGIHSLIFPERDVRKTAGFKLLKEIWDNCLVRDLPKELRDPGGTELEEPTETLTQELKSIVRGKIDPYILAQAAFQRDRIIGGLNNNEFIKLVVISSLKRKIEIPQGLLDFLTRKTIVERIFNVIGAPTSEKRNLGSDPTTHLTDTSEKFYEEIEKTIEGLENCGDNRTDVDSWRLNFWGPGGVGQEDMDKGVWMQMIKNHPFIQGHKEDFINILGQAVKILLNDQGQDGILPYRLEYGNRVLDELEKLTEDWTKEKDGHKALLSDAEWFKKDLKEFSKKCKDANKYQNDSEYKAKVISAARTRGKLVAYYLLENLCEQLLDAIESWQKELKDWRDYLRETRSLILKAESIHNTNRNNKNKIKVRTYITSPEFEESLFKAHAHEAIKAFRNEVRWTYEIETKEIQSSDKEIRFSQRIPGLWMQETVFARPSVDNPHWLQEYRDSQRKKLQLEDSILAERAINWACTKEGNRDRPDAGAIFSSLGSTTEVKMGDQICGFFETGNAVGAARQLTSDEKIATICPLTSWPFEKMIYLSCIPRHDISTGDSRVQSFYSTMDNEIRSKTNRYLNNRPYNFKYQSENPRLAYGIEMAVRWQLKDLSSYKRYASSYDYSINNKKPLHCLPEEKWAAQLYESAINYRPENSVDTKNVIIKEIEVNEGLRLVPEVVDLTIDRGRLESFVKAYALRLIFPRVQNGDIYLFPDKGKDAYRLSKLQSTEEIDSVLQDLIPQNDRITAIRTSTDNSVLGLTLINRLRLWYALRQFMLGESDIDNKHKAIPYKEIEQATEKNMDVIRPNLTAIIPKFKQWYTDYAKIGDNLFVIAHIGLLLACVAIDIQNTGN